MVGKALISRFTPSRTPPEVLEAIFVQRQALLADALERIEESATTGNKHHLLFIGPRGCGKTHLVALINHRAAALDRLKNKLRIAWLNEDESSISFLDLLIRIYRALAERYPEEFPPAGLEALFGLPEAQALDRLKSLLLAQLDNRTLLVLVENLDEVFEGLGEQGQMQWRAFLQEHPVSVTVATAQQLFEGVSRRRSPFFGFFQVQHLKPLSIGQATELLQHIARYHTDAELARFVTSRKGRARVEAVYHLSGGNHRVYIVLSKFISREALDELVGAFEKMLDELTPYYQERLRWLSPQQRKIVQHLCRVEAPVSVKDIARHLFMTHQTTSGQLKDLRDKGYVTSHSRGRESLYELAEPLMRLCVEVKENDRQPIRLIVRFLRVWYSDDQLPRLYGQYAEHGFEQALECIDKLIELAPNEPGAYFNRVEKLLHLDRWQEAWTALAEALDRFPPAESAFAGDTAALIGLIAASTSVAETWTARVRKLAGLYRSAGALSYLGSGLVQSLASTSLRDRALASWQTVWETVCADDADMQIPLRIFRTGCRYLQTQDARVRFDRVTEERRVLEAVLQIEAT